MAATILEQIQQDDLAMSVARALAVANQAAANRNMMLSDLIVTVTEETPPPQRRWKVHYGPRDYRHTRGGDLLVVVNESTNSVEQVILGQ